jgi:hypothetical protein
LFDRWIDNHMAGNANSGFPEDGWLTTL